MIVGHLRPNPERQGKYLILIRELNFRNNKTFKNVLINIDVPNVPGV